MTQKEQGAELDVLRNVPLEVTALLGSRRMNVGELLEIGEGSVVALDRSIEDPVELLVGGAVVARGEIVAVDERFGVRITSVVTSERA